MMGFFIYGARSEKMITVEIQPQLEKDFRAIVQEFYNSDEREKRKSMTWEETFDATLEAVRKRVDARGGISDEEIEQAIQRVRQQRRMAH